VATCPRCLEPIPDGAGACPDCASGAPPRAVLPDASGGPPPTLSDRYRIVKFLGCGGMGRVYLCEDTELEDEVAVKVLAADLAANDAAMALLQREAKNMAKLRNCQGILNLHDIERHGGEVVLVMEYAPGGSLHSLIHRGPGLPEEEVRRLGAAMADALALAHDRKVLHRDMKPANVLLGEDGLTRVADFGISRALADSSSQISTRGSFTGTAAYLPPEVIDRKAVDHRADLYSLGCTLYEMATGTPPYAGSFAEMAMEKTREGGRPPDPRDRREGFSEDFAGALRCLMARDPVERFPDGRTAAAVLRGQRRASAAAPGRRERLLPSGPVEPAVQGLPTPPPLPAGAAMSLPPGFAGHAGRLWCLKDGAEVVPVPAGEFLLGSDQGEPDERPQRRIHLSGFLADRHEVTVYQFARFCREKGRPMPPQPESSNDRHPVVNVTWEEASAFASWAGKTLPTEAQWEKAARGTDGRAFPWGDEPPAEDEARFHDPAEKGIVSVGAYASGVSPYGCLDMVGNAWEWVFDWYAADAYAKAADRDPIGPVEGKSRVMRGGAWNDYGERLRITKRRRSRPDSRFDFVGFRCVKDLPA